MQMILSGKCYDANTHNKQSKLSYDFAFWVRYTYHTPYRNCGYTTDVDNALDIGSWCVDGRMKREAGLVGSEGRAAKVEYISTHVHFNQTRGRYLVMHQAIRSYKEVFKVLTDSSLKRKKNERTIELHDILFAKCLKIPTNQLFWRKWCMQHITCSILRLKTTKAEGKEYKQIF